MGFHLFHLWRRFAWHLCSRQQHSMNYMEEPTQLTLKICFKITTRKDGGGVCCWSAVMCNNERLVMELCVVHNHVLFTSLLGSTGVSTGFLRMDKKVHENARKLLVTWKSTLENHLQPYYFITSIVSLLSHTINKNVRPLHSYHYYYMYSIRPSIILHSTNVLFHNRLRLQLLCWVFSINVMWRYPQ